MANSANPDLLASSLNLHCLQRQAISRFSRTRVKYVTHFLETGAGIKEQIILLVILDVG